eukprot:1093788-Pelagomonas_calceolata.AAC.1
MWIQRGFSHPFRLASCPPVSSPSSSLPPPNPPLLKMLNWMAPCKAIEDVCVYAAFANAANAAAGHGAAEGPTADTIEEKALEKVTAGITGVSYAASTK